MLADISNESSEGVEAHKKYAAHICPSRDSRDTSGRLIADVTFLISPALSSIGSGARIRNSSHEFSTSEGGQSIKVCDVRQGLGA